MKKHALKMFSMILFVVMAFSTNVFAADVNSDHGNFFDEVSNYEEFLRININYIIFLSRNH